MIHVVIPFIVRFAMLHVDVSPAVLAHSTGTEARTSSECDVLMGTPISGPRGECLRCVARPHYHYHPELHRRQRCHRENHVPPQPHHH